MLLNHMKAEMDTTMESTTIKKKPKTRIVAEIDDDLSRKLKRLRADTDKPMCRIIEEALLRHFDAVGPSKNVR